jgi:hypothetical protein
MTPDALPPKALAALQAGRKLEAIEHVRVATGMGLKEAKEWVEAYERSSATLKGRPVPAFTVPPRAVEAWKRGDFLESARITRDAFLASVAEAKAQAEQMQPGRPAKHVAPAAPHTRRHAGQMIATPFRHDPGLSPGEVPRGAVGGAWAALLMIGVVLLGLLIL